MIAPGFTQKAPSVFSIVDKRVKHNRNPYSSLFVGRLPPQTTEEDLEHLFSPFGKILGLTVVRCIVTGMPKGYAFIEFADENSIREARRQPLTLYNATLVVDIERSSRRKHWVPRRLGGGLGGNPKSHQLRY